MDIDAFIDRRSTARGGRRAGEGGGGRTGPPAAPRLPDPALRQGLAAPKTGQLDLGQTVVAPGRKGWGPAGLPEDKGEQVTAIRAVLQAAAAPMDAAAVARAFKGGGKRIEQRVVQALATLVRYAEITALPDGRFAARRAR